MQRHLGRLVDRGLVAISSLTPSDAAHVLGLQGHWNREAAELAARQFLRRPANPIWKPPAEIEQLCRDVVEQVVRQSGEVILDAAIRETSGIDPHHWGQLGRDVIRRSLSATQPADALFVSELKLNAPLAAIGAPVGSYYPEIARRLRTRLVIPPHADVSNAVGAVAGGVLQRATATITQPQEGLFRAHLATGIKDFVNLEEAARYCSDLVSAEAASLANSGRRGRDPGQDRARGQGVRAADRPSDLHRIDHRRDGLRPAGPGGISFCSGRSGRSDCVICGTAMPDIGAASGDNSVTGALLFS